jgi:hypothetical protein
MRPGVTTTKVLALIGVGVCLFGPCPVQADWGFDATAGLAYDDNLSNGLEADDRKGDTAFTATASGGYYDQLGTNTGLGLSLLADTTDYMHYTGLTNIGLGARAQLRQKFGLGADAPWTSISAQAMHHNYHYDYRDGWAYDAAASLGKQLSDRWSIRGSVRYDRFDADQLQTPIIPGISSAAYNVWGWNFGASISFLLTANDALSAGFTWRNGTVTSVDAPDYEILEYSSAVALDPVFGTSPKMVAYRIKAKTDILSLAWSHTLGRHAAVNLAYTYSLSKTGSELGNYYSNLISLSLSYSY